MSRPIIVLRPAEGADKTAEAIDRLGLSAVADPMFEVVGLDWEAPAAEDHDALLLTSANALKFAGPQLRQLVSLPVLAVGAATADAAGRAGFEVAAIGDSGAQALLDRDDLARFQHILWLAGEQRTELAISPDRLRAIPVYAANPLPLGEKARRALQQPAVILLHSARAARHLEQQVDELQIDRSKHRIAAMSETVASMLEPGWQEVAWAPQPSDDALLSVASGLCVDGA